MLGIELKNKLDDSHRINLEFIKDLLFTLEHLYILTKDGDIMFEKNNNLITVKEMQELLGIGRNTAYDLIHQNKIKCFRLGKSWKIPRQALEDYVRSETGIN